MRVKHFLFSAFLFLLSACKLQALPGINLNCDPKTDASCGGDVTKPPPDDGGGGEVDLSDCERAPDGGPYVTAYPLDGMQGRFGYPRVQINPGQKLTFCFMVDYNMNSFGIMVIDRTGVAQCFSHRSVFYPPQGSGLSTWVSNSGIPPGADWWTDDAVGWQIQSAANWFIRTKPAPWGVYKVTVEMDKRFPASCGVFELST